jgi:hypothetical protein
MGRLRAVRGQHDFDWLRRFLQLAGEEASRSGRTSATRRNGQPPAAPMPTSGTDVGSVAVADEALEAHVAPQQSPATVVHHLFERRDRSRVMFLWRQAPAGSGEVSVATRLTRRAKAIQDWLLDGTRGKRWTADDRGDASFDGYRLQSASVPIGSGFLKSTDGSRRLIALDRECDQCTTGNWYAPVPGRGLPFKVADEVCHAREKDVETRAQGRTGG